MGLLTPIRTAVWGKPAATKAERRLLVKIDTFILTSCCLQYWVNYLDRANLNNAYVSGMQQDLHMAGNDLNKINTVFWCAYFLGQIPNNLAMQYFRPRVWMPFCMLAWGLLTLGTGFVHDWRHICVLRFFQSLFEGSTFVGTHYLLGSWYNDEELGKRTGIFTSSGLAGTMFSGLLQGSIYRNLDGRHGLAGWRWMFVIDFLITVPLAVYTWLLFPDTPETTTAFYLTAEEKALAVTRLRRQPEHGHGEVTKASFRRIFSTWHIYGLCFIWTMGSNCEMFSSNAIMQLYLKSLGTFSVTKVNYMPMGVSAVGIVGTLVLGWYSDFTRRSWHVGMLLSATAITAAAIMLRPPSFAGKMFALYLNGIQYANQTVMFAWANRLVKDDENKRSFIVAAMNTSACIFYSFWSISFYAANQGPLWRRGGIAMVVSGSLMAMGTLVVRHLEQRDHQRSEVEAAAAEGSSCPSDGPDAEKGGAQAVVQALAEDK